MANNERGSKEYSRTSSWLPVYTPFSPPHQAILHKAWACGAPNVVITVTFARLTRYQRRWKPWLQEGPVRYLIEFNAPMTQMNMENGMRRRTGRLRELSL